MKAIHVSMLLLLLLMFFPLLQFKKAWAETPSQHVEKKALYFSIVPKKNVAQQLTELSPLLQLLREELGRPVETIYPQSYHAVIEGILSRTIDIAILGPASYAKARLRDNGIDAFASFAAKKGFVTPRGSFYYSVLFTVKDMGYDHINDLKGKKIAFTDPDSTSGSIIPNMAVSKFLGQPLKVFFGAHIYTGSHDRSIQSVVAKYVDAAFVSSARIDEAIRNGSINRDQVVILWQSKPIHSDPFVFSSGVDPELRDRIKRIILSSPPQLKPMLEKMQMAGIEAVNDEDYRAIHDIVAMQMQKP